ncbi:Cytochrome P450 [Mycena venus]|uniref:Cytochrome P450 n=1 Tax=Mycena venus TaxID=2733690 RepID=A0A8H7D457_9AGAR|nr:Cytochrome P450 [Mycena venus]
MYGFEWSVTIALITWFYCHTRKVRGDTAVIVVCFLAFMVFSLVYASVVISPVGHSVSASLLHSTLLIATHIFAALVLTVLYRVSPFHPLYAIPGPFWYKISSMRLAYTTSTGKRHLVIKGLHEKYGNFVRTGPNMLSINSANAVSQIYTQANCMDKSDAYVLGRQKNVGLFFLPQREKHNSRKKSWAPAFSPSALASYHPCVERRAKALQACIERRMNPVSKSVNLTECFQHWAYDLMGDIVFGGSNRLELMEEGDPSKYVNAVQLATIGFEILGEVPWLFDILWHLPATGNLHTFEKRAGQMMKVRQQDNHGPHNDIAAHLLGEVGSHSVNLTDGELAVDGSLAITAGSDSTSSIMSFIFYFLTSNPDKFNRLRKELDEAFPTGTPLTFGGLSNLAYLNAVIDESLRLGTPFPGLPRVVPKGGSLHRWRQNPCRNYHQRSSVHTTDHC